MKSVLKLCLLCVVLLSANTAASAQAEDRLTAEKEEVAKLAKKFSERYEQTKSLEPLIGEFFTPYFNANLPRSIYFQDLIVVDVVEADRYLLRRFYVSFNDFIYLRTVWAWQAGCKSSGIRCYPKNVLRTMRRDPLLADIFIDDDVDTKPLGSLKQLTRTINALEECTRIYRSRLSNFPRTRSPQYAVAYSAFEENMDNYFEPFGLPCDGEYDCYGLPKGSTIYQVTVPPALFLQIARVDGNMKVADVLPWMD